MTLRGVETLVAAGKTETIEFKSSTGELREAMQTLCAFVNGGGGQVLLGVRPDGRITGQQVSEQTLRDVSVARDRFEPARNLSITQVELESGSRVLVLAVSAGHENGPYVYDGHPSERVANTTRRMPQERYEALFLERAHTRRR